MPSKLILTLDGEILKEVILNQPSTSVGRKRDNEIQLNDLTVSGRHAMISCRNGHDYIEDLGSTNGTLINGNHISKSPLVHGNVIQIGHHLFTYLMDEKEKYEPTMFVKAELDETQIVLPDWDMDSQAVNVRGQPLGCLRKVDDPYNSTGIEMRKTYSTVGFQGQKLALISRNQKGYSIVGVKNGLGSDQEQPKLNGKIIDSISKHLHDHDIISISGIEMEFYYVH